MEIPRKLTNDEIDSIINNMRFSKVQNTPVQDNVLNIHKIKTKRKLEKIEIKPSKIIALKKAILDQFYKSLIACGEAVGVNAAQCIGEPTTQLCVRGTEGVQIAYLVEDEIRYYNGTIENFVDTLLDYNSEIVITDNNESKYLDLNNFYVASINQKEKIIWKKISQVTRHRPRGDLIKIKTLSGREVTCTLSHSFLKRSERGIEPIKGKDLHKGDRIPVIKNIPKLNLKQQNDVDSKLCWLLGYYVYDFSHAKQVHKQINLTYRELCKNNTSIPDLVFQLSNDKLGDFLRGVFIDGIKVSDTNLEYKTYNSNILKQLCLLLSRFNIFTIVNNYNLFISGYDNILLYFRHIGSYNEDQQMLLYSLLNNNFEKVIDEDIDKIPNIECVVENLLKKFKLENDDKPIKTDRNTLISYTKQIDDLLKNRWFISRRTKYELDTVKQAVISDVVWDKIIEMELIPEPDEYVYDFTVPGNETFALNSGILVHNTLNSFHSAGISAKSVTLGFPRARELFNSTKSPSNPSCAVYFMYNNDTLENLHKITDKFVEKRIQQLLLPNGYSVIEPDNYVLEYWHMAWFKLHPEMENLKEDEWILRLKFDVSKLYKNDLTIKEISDILISKYEDIRIITSPLNLGILDIIVNCNEINFSNERTKEYNDIQNMYDSRIFYMKNIVSPTIRGNVCCGITGIKEIYRRKASPDEIFGGFPLKPEIKERITSDKEWIIDTDGTNLREILIQPGVDPYRTISNDMWEILNVFGIEAARQYLFLEFLNIAKHGGLSINDVHFQILISKMTYTGSIRSIARFGVETSQYGPISRATFEEVMSQLVTSAIFSEKDELNGISSNIVLGTKINAGTGTVNTEEIPLKILPKKDI